MSEFGVHVTIDASKCNKMKLASISTVYSILDKLPEKIGMTKMTLPYAVKWMDKFAHGTEGISGFVMIAESHISIHTFPDQDYVFMDIFSCRNFDAESAIRYLTGAFEAKKFDKHVLKRGIDFPSKEELIASNKTVKEIADFLQVDSLEYLSIEGMLAVVKNSKDFCHACFSGQYPVAIPKNKSKYLLEGSTKK